MQVAMRPRTQIVYSRQSLLWIGVGLLVIVGDYFMIWKQLHETLQPNIALMQQPVVHFTQQMFQSATSIKRMWYAAQELQALEVQYSQTITQLQDVEQVRSENRALRALLENSDRTLQRVVVAAPIVSFAMPAVQIGSQDGVQVGSVVVGEGTVLGVLSEVSSTNSRVELLAQLQSKPILAQTATGVQGLVRGERGSIWLTEVPSDAQIAVGERVATVGQVGIPKGLLIGVVSSTYARPQDATMQIQVRQLVSFYTTPLVEIY